MNNRVALLTLTALLLLLNAGCNDSRLVLGEAYVAPATVYLRTELSSKSKVVTDLKHGDRLQVIDVQRRMVKVRTEKGVEGWVDSLQLLSPEQMDQLRKRRGYQGTLPPEGTATAYEVLNVHIDPDRQSPAFAQIAEGASVTILGHKIAPKNTSSRSPGLVISRPQSLSRKQRKEQQNRSASFRLPPKPQPPKAPANWQQLSAERIDGGGDDDEQSSRPNPAIAAVPAKPEAVKPPVLEDWMLVRTKKNEIGWVLSRNLLMSIPDEVAQYAEGKRITAFFDLGTVNDEVKGPKHHWLWTTAAHALPFDYDSWRVFLWNSRRHRYETSFRKRDLEGYFPVHVEPADPGSPMRSFSLITKDEDGKLRCRSYTFDGHLVHLGNTEDYSGATGTNVGTTAALNPKDMESKAPKPGWFKRQWLTIRHLFTGN